MRGDAERWDAELAARMSPPPLLQSWAWGELQSRAGWSVERVHLDGGAVASVQMRKVGPATEAYVPRGPVPATLEAIDALVGWARGAGVARLVVEPEASGIDEEMSPRGFAKTKPVQPQHTRILPLAPPAELLKSFQKGRRYNIRTGERRGVTVEEGKDADELARQSAAVARRESISLPDRGYYRNMLDLLPWCRTYTARAPDDREALATVLVARHGSRAYSLFAGRTGRRPELMGNDLAWWAAISGAADAGLEDVDFWGVPPPRSGPNHPWHGLGMFKSEFGGREVGYVGAWEVVLSASGARWLGAERKARAYIRGLKRNIP
jgi:lipid II:glycine glycyltransferase (peptidoglycan interpeptide bridge formation enzyme)